MLDFAFDIGFRAQLAHEGNEDLIASFGAEHLPEIFFVRFKLPVFGFFHFFQINDGGALRGGDDSA